MPNERAKSVQKRANLVELETCCQTHVYLQTTAPLQPGTSRQMLSKKAKWYLSAEREGADPDTPRLLGGLNAGDVEPGGSVRGELANL